jgi:3-oxoacyl-[acyl-carrier-protein] synthase-3
MGIEITGVGAYAPTKIVDNHELSRTVDTTHEWITSHTGILERRIAEPGECPSHMGTQAALRCLTSAGVSSSVVDLIVVASATPDQSQPATACLIQDMLGISASHCPAFDVNSVCAGFVFALDVAQSMMLASPERYRNALVIGTDAFSRILDWQDRSTCIFFGDGAGAVLLTASEGDARRMFFALGSDGRGSRLIEVPAGGTREPVTALVLEQRRNKFAMHGPKVWDFAMQTVSTVIRSLLAEHGLTPGDLGLVILHQSNLRMIEAIMAALELPMDRTVTTIETHGNTAAASIPLTLQKAHEAGRLRAGDHVMLCGFGGGLSWGAALLEW